MKRELTDALPLAEAFCRLLHPFAEVVIHDLANGTIAAVYNSRSASKVGDPSPFDPAEFEEEKETVVGPYPQISDEGRELKSLVLLLRDPSSRLTGLLSINVDISSFVQIHRSLSLFLERGETKEQEKSLFKEDLHEEVNLFVDSYCRERKKRLESMSRNEKRDLVLLLKEEGAFDCRHGAHYVARILGISRATVYNYLKTS